MSIRGIISKFARDREGGTAIEYSLIATLITIGLIAAITYWGDTATGMYERLSDRGWGDSEAGSE